MMPRDVNQTDYKTYNLDALKSEIRLAIINQKVNACPIASRLAWHASGTFDINDASKPGGSNGGTMRFPPERDDPDNAGLSIIRDMLLPVKRAHPDLSFGDLYTAAGCFGIEFLGGPKIPFGFGRIDHEDGINAPAHGRLPDATKDAAHLREIFVKRMGFSDREIVALSGGHTLGSCHSTRSGFEGPWTTQPLRFDNEYFKNLLHLTWVPRKWMGPLQFEDVETGTLMMLPSDIALIEDPGMRPFVEEYVKDEQLFFRDFAQAYGKLLALGCPASCQPDFIAPEPSEQDKLNAEFRKLAMHGSVGPAILLAPKCDVHQLDPSSGRSALHMAAFWGHNNMLFKILQAFFDSPRFLVVLCKLDVNVRDNHGDTALHDAAKFGHETIVKILLENGADKYIKNNEEKDPLALAIEYEKPGVVELLQ